MGIITLFFSMFNTKKYNTYLTNLINYEYFNAMRNYYYKHHKIPP